MPDVPVGDWAGTWEKRCGWLSSPFRSETMMGRIPPRLLRRARAGYYGHVTHIDLQIHRILEALGGYQVAANTVVCFTSDHGEMLGDHHLFRKCFPYEGSARVPMILKGPARLGLQRGGAVGAPVELRDVMPTLLDCAGLPIPESVEGRSFLPLARGEKCDWRSHLHGEHALFNQSLHYVTDGHEKYIWLSGDGHEQLFDLDTDPHELRDLAPERPQRVAHWRQVLIEELTGREEGFTDGQRLITGRPVQATLAHVRES